MQDGFFQPIESCIIFFGKNMFSFLWEIAKFLPTLTVLSHIYTLQEK